MKVQGYIELDYQAMTDEQFIEFNQFLHQYLMYYHRVNRDTESSREYYFCILENHELLPVLMQAMAARNPIVNGLWDIEGTPYCKVKEVDAETGDITISGDAEYSFDLALHLVHTPAELIVDSEGNVTEVEVTEFKPLHGFAGWALCQEY